jgi:hypothetical protein
MITVLIQLVQLLLMRLTNFMNIGFNKFLTNPSIEYASIKR